MTHDDTTLERLMREGLHARADQLDLSVPEVGRGRRAWGRPTVWLAGAAAAAVAIGTPFAWQAVSDQSDPNGGAPRALPMPQAGRAESYGGIQVVVPVDWAVGAGPMTEDFPDQSAVWCADLPAGPYVGRPVFASDVCMGFDPDRQEPPRDDSVWFDAPVPVGVRTVGDHTQVTRELAGVTITVTTRDPALGEQILASAEALDVDANACRTHLDGPPFADTMAAAASVPLAVCVYDVAPDLSTTLIWSGNAGEDAAAAYADAVAAARGTGDEVAACKRAPEGQWVALGRHTRDGLQWDVVDFACGKIISPGGDVRLSRATVEPWASDGTRAYVVGPHGVDGADWSGLFRGMLG